MTQVGGDLMERILSTLPPKALMRFKCASKGWNELINHPRLVAKHLSNYNSNSNSKHLLVMKKRLVSSDATNDTQEEEEGEEEEEHVFSLLNLCITDDDIENGEDNIIVSSVEDITVPPCLSVKTRRCTDLRSRGEGFRIVGHCNGIICLLLLKSFQVLLWNPAIQDFKLIPSFPYLPDEDWFGDVWSEYVQGFGYDPKLNEYKVVNIGLVSPSDSEGGYDINHPPKAAVYTLGTDSWRDINTNALETETTVLRPESFRIQFKQNFYWLGHEQGKEVYTCDRDEDLIRQIIILFDIVNELFHDIMLPDALYQPWVHKTGIDLRVWNESPALFVLVWGLQGYGPEEEYSFVIWVLDEHGGWTKHITLEPTEKPLAFLNSNGIFMTDFMGHVFSYDLGSKRFEDIFFHNTPYEIETHDQSDFAAVVYVKSIVSVSGAQKPESRDNSRVANFSPLSCPSIVDRECHSYSIWAIPSDDVSLRIKKVMEGLRDEFGGPEIEPHIPVVSSIRMTHEEVVNKFRSLSSKDLRAYQGKVNLVVTRSFYYQCVSLLIDSSTKESSQLEYTNGISTAHFGFYLCIRPYMSLLYGNLTEKERRRALEKVRILDESISSLRFTIAQLAVYKINYKDTTLNSWEKIAEYTLPFH